ncbi:MAG: hypothetical protein WAL37_05440 [Xanthobacteraceae bacterium]
MSFSDRLGITKPKSILQTDSIDADLRNGLWQACIEHYLKEFGWDYGNDTRFKGIMESIYVDFFKYPSDAIPYGHEAGIATVRKWFFQADWWQIYNFIEFLLSRGSGSFADRVSFFLTREKSGYRIIDGKLVPITDSTEVASVSDAASIGDKFAGAREHMRSAISLFSKKPEPDYRNFIKEAVSAVESVARVVTGNPKATLGDALKRINDKMTIHPALRDAMNKLYGYTSDEGGIRHAMLEESNIDEAEAKFMIVACSAFVNFCVQRSQ